MYLRTPKRYTRGRKRSPISLRWLWLWILTPIVVVLGVTIYNNRATLGPPVHQAIYNALDNAQQSLATAAAPPPVPTQDPANQLARANTDWRDGRIEAAIDTYEGVLDAAPNNLEIRYRLALGRVMEGDLEGALEAAESAITADPFASDGFGIRSMVLDWSDRYGEAVASALRAIELNDQSARAYAFLAMAYKDMGQTDLAQQMVDKALEIDPNSFEALNARGWIAWTVEFDSESARDYFSQAFDAAPNLSYLAIDLSRVIYGLSPDQPEEAIGYLNDVIDQNPQNTRALFELGRIYYSGLGDPNQALDYLVRCAEINPKSTVCQGLLGRVYMALDQYTEAADVLQKAVDLGSTNPRHYLWAGRTQIALGNCPSAVPLLQKSITLAEQVGDTEAVSASQDNLSECSVVVPGVEVTPEATPSS
jgi:tetratricopeptide (TPR) repeat protein